MSCTQPLLHAIVNLKKIDGGNRTLVNLVVMAMSLFISELAAPDQKRTTVIKSGAVTF